MSGLLHGAILTASIDNVEFVGIYTANISEQL